ncbi:MAG: histidine triad nucleotide-binding protein [Actinomycetota bacterium]
MAGCLFCQIASGDIDADVVYQGESTLAFRDIHPQAPVHLLVIPKEHLSNAADLTHGHGPLLAEMVATAQWVAKSEGVGESGYRLVMNVGEDGGQTVGHLHLHVLGGRPMTWPPG